MRDFDECDRLSVTVWFRPITAAGSGLHEELLSRLQRLEADGTIGELTIKQWRRRIEYTPEHETSELASPVQNRLAEFREWAAERDHDLRPGFEWRETTSIVSDERREVVVLPVACIELRGETELLAVFPCTSDGEANTVFDCLQRLESIEMTSPSPEQLETIDPSG